MTVPVLVLAGSLLTCSSILAQSNIWGTVSGSVSDPAGRPVGSAVVTLQPLGTAGSIEVTADASGEFGFRLVSPGAYELRAEALGYRPLVARTVTVSGGEDARVELVVQVAPPPVTRVDTTFLRGASGRWRPGGTHFGRPEFESLPDRLGDLASVAALAPHTSLALGAAGLPGSATTLVVDGVPFQRAAHPVARSESLPRPLFPPYVLSGLSVHNAAPDVEWLGSAGTLLVAATAPSSGSGSSVAAAWSGDPLWSSSELGFSTPSLTSFRGAARADMVITPGMAGITFGAEAFQEETPLGPRIDEAVLTSLAGLDPDLTSTLVEPSTERISSYSAFVRGDVRRSDASALFFRGLVAYSRREFEGPGPVTLARDAAPPAENVDYSVAGGFVTHYGSSVDLELRAGLSGSNRTFEAATVGMPAAQLAESGYRLGVLAAGAGESSRLDFHFSPLVHYRLAAGALKLGVSALVSSQTMSGHPTQELLFSNGSALTAGRGFGRSMDASDASFTTTEIGAFAQYAWEPSTGVALTLGGRYDRESVPASDVDLNTDWRAASGLSNRAFPSGLGEWSALGTLAWRPVEDAGTTLLTAVALDHGDVDPRVLHQVLAQDVGATSVVHAGAGLVWPGGPLPPGATTLPTLTMLGPDTRAPRSLHASIGAVQQLVAGWSLRVEGAYRRTDFLMRRRNLNLPAAVQRVDAYGRGVFGTLAQDGSLVTATGADARRFSGFHEVWALDPDGWSEYRGLTVAVEHSSPGRWLHASYTRSETTDNWIGAAAGSIDAELSPLLPEGEDWSEDTSDYDARHRVSAAGALTMGILTASTAYHFRSGYPFTPGYRAGTDANGDGSFRNDVAFVDPELVDPLLGSWPCLEDQLGGFAERNSCRGPVQHSLDVRLSLRIGRLWNRDASLVIEGLDVIETKDGVVDGALLLVDPSGAITTSPDGTTVTIPAAVNPDFGRVIYPASRGRMIRIGFRIG